jgi:hypothetical protein
VEDRFNVVLAWRIRAGCAGGIVAACTLVHGNNPVLVRGESPLFHNSLGEEHTCDTDGLFQTTVTHDSPLNRATLAGVSSCGRPINALMSKYTTPAMQLHRPNLAGVVLVRVCQRSVQSGGSYDAK